MDSTAVIAEIKDSPPTGTEQEPEDGRLSTIPEGTQETDTSEEIESDVGSYLQHSDPYWRQWLDNIDDDFQELISTPAEPVQHDDLSDRMPLSLLNVPAESIVLATPLEVSQDQYVELAIYPPMTRTLALDREPKNDDIVLLQMGYNTVRQAVVKRDDDTLTQSQLKELWPEVQHAMLT